PSGVRGTLTDATSDQFDILSVVGTYALQTVNGSELRAAVITAGSDTVEATQGLLELRDDGTYGFAVSFRTVESGSVRASPQTEAGTYAVTGMNIQFSDRTIFNNPVILPDTSGGPRP
ncbi:MAG: hypothetical protein O6944_07960, partial [Gammaproteobacteria bacterium]|nr:hypothetical protein [Gammaproteobacteria bacterium]